MRFTVPANRVSFTVRDGLLVLDIVDGTPLTPVAVAPDGGSAYVAPPTPAPVELDHRHMLADPTQVISVGKRLRMWREWARLSQTDVAVKVGYSQGFISAIENEKVHPADYVVAKLLRLMGP